MPQVTLLTNLAEDAVSNAFIQRFAKVLADLTGKPENIIEVFVQSNMKMWMAGSLEPAVYMTFSVIPSLVGVTDDEKDRYCSTICSYVMEELNIPKERVELGFVMFDASNVGHVWGTVKSSRAKQTTTLQ